MAERCHKGRTTSTRESYTPLPVALRRSFSNVIPTARRTTTFPNGELHPSRNAASTVSDPWRFSVPVDPVSDPWTQSVPIHHDPSSETARGGTWGASWEPLDLTSVLSALPDEPWSPRSVPYSGTAYPSVTSRPSPPRYQQSAGSSQTEPPFPGLAFACGSAFAPGPSTASIPSNIAPVRSPSPATPSTNNSPSPPRPPTPYYPHGRQPTRNEPHLPRTPANPPSCLLVPVLRRSHTLHVPEYNPSRTPFQGEFGTAYITQDEVDVRPASFADDDGDVSGGSSFGDGHDSVRDDGYAPPEVKDPVVLGSGTGKDEKKKMRRRRDVLLALPKRVADRVLKMTRGLRK